MPGKRARREREAVPSTSELVALGAPIELRDGSHVRIRQGHSSDRELLLEGFERLSEESRYRRFLAPTAELSETMVRHLIEVDHRDHEAMIAIDDGTGEGVGVARYVRHAPRPEAAEVAVTVVDDWQGRGLGTVLLEAISVRAREEGITTFTASLLAKNQEMLDLFERLAPVRVIDHEAGTIEVEFTIPAVGMTPALRKLLQVAARHDVAVPLTGPRWRRLLRERPG
jgi:GNAT superfamily N-acetyltransferase